MFIITVMWCQLGLSATKLMLEKKMMKGKHSLERVLNATRPFSPLQSLFKFSVPVKANYTNRLTNCLVSSYLIFCSVYLLSCLVIQVGQ